MDYTLICQLYMLLEKNNSRIGKKLIRFLEQDEWCLNSNLIEIPSSKSSHGFYHKLGYEYRTYPLIFKEDGSTIMYKYK